MECGRVKSRTTYGRSELEDMAAERLGMSAAEARRMTKRELCEALGIRWREKAVVAAHKEKVCSGRKTRLYPERYTRDELVARVRARNPYTNKSKLRRQPFRVLCGLAGLPFIDATTKTATSNTKATARPERSYVPTSGTRRAPRPAFDYQRRVVEHFDKHRGLIAVHSLGSGKTLTAILASQRWLRANPQGKVVVVSPASLIANFKKEMNNETLAHTDRYEFFSYQGFYYEYKEGRGRDCHGQFLIVDEAHNLRTAYHKSKSGKEKGKMTRVITQCAVRADKVLLLTATPLVNKRKDIAPLLDMVRDKRGGEVSAKSIKTDEGLRDAGLCKFSFYERGRADRDYPRTTYEDVYLTMRPRFRAVYDKVEQETMDDEVMRSFGEDTKLRPFFNGVRRAVNILSELPEEDMLKSEKIRWIVNQLRDDPKKTLIFSHFLESGVEAILGKVRALGLRTAYITGSQPKGRRAEIVEAYNRDEVDVLFISKAGGEGLDLKGTRRIVLMESGWNENSESQVIGRGVRFQSHSHLPQGERNVVVCRLHHIKEGEDVGEILSAEYDYKEAATWPSADLLLKKISTRKAAATRGVLRKLKELSIEKNEECR